MTSRENQGFMCNFTMAAGTVITCYICYKMSLLASRLMNRKSDYDFRDNSPTETFSHYLIYLD